MHLKQNNPPVLPVGSPQLSQVLGAAGGKGVDLGADEHL